MQKINLWVFYVVGYRLHAVAEIDPAKCEHVGDIIIPMHTAEGAVEMLCRHDVKLSDTTTIAGLRLIQHLHDCRMTLGADDFHLHPSTSSERVGSILPLGAFNALKEEIKAFETILSNEFPGLSTFYVPQKGTHNTSALMTEAVSNLPSRVVSNLSDDAKDNINSAGRCLAIDSPTASGFHILRAVECLMREYHFKLTGAALPVKSRNWGAMIKSLEKHEADLKVTGFLTHIKDFYRNPIVHPEENLIADEAHSLFNASLSAITMLDSAINP